LPGQQDYRKALLISRQRKVPGGNKTDHVDAWSLADALRVDGHGWKALAKEDPLMAELRLLCRDAGQ
jgi:Transposase